MFTHTQYEYVTIWEFRSVDGKQVVQKAHPQYPDDYSFEHEYQKIVFRGRRDEYQKIA